MDGRRPYAQIGRELQVPEATVRQRAERLISRGAWSRWSASPIRWRWASSSRPSSACTWTPAGSTEIAEQVAALDEVTYVVVTAGRFDIICEVVCEDNEHLLRVLTDSSPPSMASARPRRWSSSASSRRATGGALARRLT